MGFAEILTIVFVVLKLLDVIAWSWWLVLLPEIIAFVLYTVVSIVGLTITHKTHKIARKQFNYFDNF